MSYPDLPRPEYDRVRSGYKITIWKDPPQTESVQAPMEFRCDLVKVSWKGFLKRSMSAPAISLSFSGKSRGQPSPAPPSLVFHTKWDQQFPQWHTAEGGSCSLRRKLGLPSPLKVVKIVRGLMKAQSIKWRVSVVFEHLRFAFVHLSLINNECIYQFGR